MPPGHLPTPKGPVVPWATPSVVSLPAWQSWPAESAWLRQSELSQEHFLSWSQSHRYSIPNQTVNSTPRVLDVLPSPLALDHERSALLLAGGSASRSCIALSARAPRNGIGTFCTSSKDRRRRRHHHASSGTSRLSVVGLTFVLLLQEGRTTGAVRRSGFLAGPPAVCRQLTSDPASNVRTLSPPSKKPHIDRIWSIDIP